MTLLCYSSGWTKGNVGLKYLKIIRNTIEKDNLIEEDDETRKEISTKKNKRMKKK